MYRVAEPSDEADWQSNSLVVVLHSLGGNAHLSLGNSSLTYCFTRRTNGRFVIIADGPIIDDRMERSARFIRSGWYVFGRCNAIIGACILQVSKVYFVVSRPWYICVPGLFV